VSTHELRRHRELFSHQPTGKMKPFCTHHATFKMKANDDFNLLLFQLYGSVANKDRHQDGLEFVFQTESSFSLFAFLFHISCFAVSLALTYKKNDRSILESTTVQFFLG
jgi:hypothetical protein